MKWLGAEPATEDSESPSGMLGNGHAPTPQMLRHPQVSPFHFWLNNFMFILIYFKSFIHC